MSEQQPFPNKTDDLIHILNQNRLQQCIPSFELLLRNWWKNHTCIKMNIFSPSLYLPPLHTALVKMRSGNVFLKLLSSQAKYCKEEVVANFYFWLCDEVMTVQSLFKNLCWLKIASRPLFWSKKIALDGFVVVAVVFVIQINVLALIIGAVTVYHYKKVLTSTLLLIKV